MGVLRRNSRLLMSNYSTLDDYLLGDESEDEIQSENDVNETIAQSFMSHRRRQKDGRNMRKSQWLNDITGDLNMIKKGRMGARKQRRYENARLLYSMVDVEDICEDYSDILQSTVTALSKLFTEEENMQAWNTFIDKNEEEQREFLERSETEELHQHCSCSENSYQKVDSFEQQASGGSFRVMNLVFQIVNDWKGHPLHSAEASFSRLNRRFRMLLRHKTLPLEFMAVNEKEMRKFFHENILPVSEWSSSVLPRLQRLIIHALSQYLSLISKSVIIGRGDEKLVKVRNKYCSFRPPSVTLVDYLKRMNGDDNGGKNLP
uniref:R3H-assoc domain-containing protein n=1 Tax=Elaeophora elaphi TaxID=1147741 RepID=A0A0R3RRP0_9BILA